MQPCDAAHSPVFASHEDLNKANEALRKRVSKAKADLLSLHLDDDDPSATAPKAEDLGAWADASTLLPREQIAERFRRYPHGFYVHPDGRSLTLVVRPAGRALRAHEGRQML